MLTIVAATGVGAWVLLIGVGIAGLAFGMLIDTMLTNRRKK